MLVTNDGGTGGALRFDRKGRINFKRIAGAAKLNEFSVCATGTPLAAAAYSNSVVGEFSTIAAVGVPLGVVVEFHTKPGSELWPCHCANITQ